MAKQVQPESDVQQGLFTKTLQRMKDTPDDNFIIDDDNEAENRYWSTRDSNTNLRLPDTGATDKITFAKARMKSFYKHVVYFHEGQNK